MSQTIEAVDTERHIQHGILLDLTLNNTTYYLSTCAGNLVYNGNTYTGLAGYLSISEIQSNIANSNDELSISLSAFPADYLDLVVDTPIKGGSVSVYRAFFDNTTNDLITAPTTQVKKRFSGIISNYAVQEDIDISGQGGSVNHTITIICSSLMGWLENKISGRRTNQQDYQSLFANPTENTYINVNTIQTDPSMNRVQALYNANFDFGRPYKGTTASTPSGASGTGGGGSDSSSNIGRTEFVAGP